MKDQTENISPPLKKLKVEAEPVISEKLIDSDSSKTVFDPLCIQNEKTGDLFVIPSENYDKNIKRKTRKWRPIMKMNPFPIKEYLQLSFVEAFFLCYGLGCLIVQNSERNIDIKSLWKLFCTKQRNFIPSYICYHYFRSKGWVPKSGLKFGCDYILYKVGPPFYHGSYSVIIQYVEEGSLKPVSGYYQRKLSWRSLCGLNRITEHVGKEVLICYVIKPKSISDETFSSDFISHFKVKEIMLSRWVSSQERQNKETEDIP
ncbi:hypothetical protein LOTGIDRAFT_200224 [Lottia gigantea]|uniref:tRNA-intron lyase n=1 Tax=Lottia gigantea TaxID=225164 RepID=V4AW24_LOTGI|nr:hypothetical protein LOTGIDRAFT_200224 [Lottia gigantea]ESP01623.1 hypothetical protein LOTGIDRAFT_200224 [Lottia gigantea]